MRKTQIYKKKLKKRLLVVFFGFSNGWKTMEFGNDAIWVNIKSMANFIWIIQFWLHWNDVGMINSCSPFNCAGLSVYAYIFICMENVSFSESRTHIGSTDVLKSAFHLYIDTHFFHRINCAIRTFSRFICDSWVCNRQFSFAVCTRLLILDSIQSSNCSRVAFVLRAQNAQSTFVFCFVHCVLFIVGGKVFYSFFFCIWQSACFTL